MWLLSCWLFCFAGWGFADEAEGILYYAQGGSGAGQVQLLVNGKLLRLHYAKDKLKDLAPPAGWRYGSYWRVTYQGKSLQEIRFLNKAHPQVSAADQMLRQHYRLMAQQRWSDAYGDFSSAWRKRQSMAAFEKGNSGVRFVPDPPLYGLKVIGHNPREVWLLMDGSAFMQGSRSFYRVVVKIEDGRPVLESVQPVSQADFEAG
jgi:hypothetical protein